MPLTPAAVSQVRRAVRGALLLEGGASAPGWTWRGQVPEPAFVAAVERHRVGLLLADHAEALDLPEAVRARLRAQRDAERRAALDLIRLTSYVDGLLADVAHLHLKGVALATLSTGDPAARGGGDVDVVVDPGRLDDAAAALVADGWTVRPTYTSDQDAWAWRYQRWGAHEMAFDRAGLTVDLHWRLDPTYDGLPRFADLWTRRQQVKVGPVEVETLGTADAFAHSLRHAAKDGWESLRSLVDVHRLAREPAAHEVALGRLDHATLSAVDATVGLPPMAPSYRRTAAPLPRMLAAQAAPVRHARFPGQRTLRQAEYRWRTSRGPRDVVVNAVTLLVPPASTAPVSDPGPVGAISRSLRLRLRQVGWKLSGWRTEL